jgi:hypothetical protein
MNQLELHVLDSSAATRPLSGCWKLGARQALTLKPVQPGVLRITHGRVWITFDHACHDGGVKGGDHFLESGESFRLLPGQALVMEAWSPAKHSAAYFSWDPLPASEGLSVSTRPARMPVRSPVWQAGVLQPLRDLGLALGLAGAASARLAAGLVAAPARVLMALAPRFGMGVAAAGKRAAGK